MIAIFFFTFLIINSSTSSFPLTKIQTQNSLPLNNSKYFQYSGNFQLGTPGQNVSFVLDNNEKLSWVNIVNGNYKINQSTSVNITQNSTSIDYGLGTVTGLTGSEILASSPMNISNLSIPLIFGNNVTNTGIMVDGILGLSNDNSTQNFIQLAVTKGQISDSLFGFFFSDTTQNNSAQFYVGSLSFPSSKPLTWVNTTMSNYWAIPITNTIVSVQSYPAGSTTNHAIIDSASSILLIGSNAYTGLTQDQYFSQQCQLSGSYYICTCPSTQNLAYPRLQFGVSSSLTLTVTPTDYMLQLSGTYCLLGVQSQQQLNVIVLGDILMNNYFVGFDKTRSRVGFSAPNNNFSKEEIKGFLQKE